MFEMIFLAFEKRAGVVVNGDGVDFIADSIELAAPFTRVVFAGDFFHNIQTVRDLAKYRVAVVEEGCRSGGDEELGAVGARSGVGHGENSGAFVAEFGVEFIRKFVTRTTATRLGRVTTLKHETIDHPVKRNPVVVTALGEIEEVGAGQRGFGGVESRVDVAGGGVECDFDIVHVNGSKSKVDNAAATDRKWGDLSRFN